MKVISTTVILLFVAATCCGQQLLSGTYDFQTDPAKEYSIYIPSTYDEASPTDMMLALHPWNTARWNAHSWCDTLKTFAESNGLLVVCPDGGADGKVDDAIDTAFTSFLIDRALEQYNVNEEQIFAIGFSWGAKTVYTYGLQHADLFAGYIPVGAAVVSSEVSPFVDDSADQSFFVIHGSQDSPNTRYTPIVNLLDGPHCVESRLLQGVGHTIDFEGRNDLLTEAYLHLKNNACGATATLDNSSNSADILESNYIVSGGQLRVKEELKSVPVVITNMYGSIVMRGLGKTIIAPDIAGAYLILAEGMKPQRFVVY